MDLGYLVNQIKAPQTGLKLRQGTVISVNADRTMNVQIAGDGYTLPSVRYLSNYAPKPDDQVWLLNDGPDLLGFGMVAAAGRTLSPKAYRTAAYATTANVETKVPFQAVENDDWNCWDSGAPTRLTIPLTGRYQIQAQAKWSDGASGTRQISIKINNTQEIAYANASKASGHGTHTTCISPPVTLTKGDYVEMLEKSDIALSLIVTADGDNYVGWFPSMSLIYLGS